MGSVGLQALHWVPSNGTDACALYASKTPENKYWVILGIWQMEKIKFI